MREGGGRGYPIGQSGDVEVVLVVCEHEGGGLEGGGHAGESDDENNAADDLGRRKVVEGRGGGGKVRLSSDCEMCIWKLKFGTSICGYGWV